MDSHAQGDCKKELSSSDVNESQQDVDHNPRYVSPLAVAMMSRLNIRDTRFAMPGTSGEAPALPIPPTTDDTDRQFWAEDEMSSSESRLHLVCKQRRRHSVAYRNRLVTHKRSRSPLYQSSSSISDPATDAKVLSLMMYNARRRRKCSHEQGPSATKKSRAGSISSAFGTCTRRHHAPIISNSSTCDCSIENTMEDLNSRRQTQVALAVLVQPRASRPRPYDTKLPAHPQNQNENKIQHDKIK